jgi:hypothetical protein
MSTGKGGMDGGEPLSHGGSMRMTNDKQRKTKPLTPQTPRLAILRAFDGLKMIAMTVTFIRN